MRHALPRMAPDAVVELFSLLSIRATPGLAPV